jgi:hypothetical protein
MPIRSRPDEFSWGDYLPYPFFMGYAATYLRRATGAEVHFRDSIALRESYESWFQYVLRGRYEYLFLESASPSWEHDQQLIEYLHRWISPLKIVVTGPIATAQAEPIIRTLPVHACIRGEYEKGSVTVIEGASGLIDFDFLTTEEMNAAPPPYYDQVIAHRYVDFNPRGQVFPHAQVWSTRGCPFKCIFCVWPATMTGNDPDGSGTRRVRYYSPDYMQAFLTELVKRYSFRSIYFDDDTFNLGTAHVLKMCQVMRRIGLPWSAMCRADTVKRETWAAMKEAGCFGVKLGFESGCQEVVNQIISKNLDLELAREVVLELKRLGMTVHGTFTYGLPGETKEQMLQTRRYIASLPLDSCQESGTAEIEGTPLATLRARGSLPQYAGARIDTPSVAEADGNKKWARIAAELRDS